MGRDSTAGVVEAHPAVRWLPPPPMRPRRPGVIPHPDEIMAENKRVLADLLAVLAKNGTQYALVGGLVAGLYGRDRATVDVDLLVARAAMDALAKDLAARGYRIERNEDMLRAYVRRVAVADLVAREANPVLEAASEKTVRAKMLGLPVDVVPRGAFVALKFHAAISPTRKIQDKYQDVADIGNLLERRFSPGDERTATRIAAKIYPGAEVELSGLLDDLRHGRRVRI